MSVPVERFVEALPEFEVDREAAGMNASADRSGRRVARQPAPSDSR